MRCHSPFLRSLRGSAPAVSSLSRLPGVGLAPLAALASKLGYIYARYVVEVLPSRVFMNGNSQAVRIPAEFRLSTDRVQISRTAEGDLLIHPCPAHRGQALLEVLAGFDDDFVTAMTQQQSEKSPIQQRESL